MIFVDLYLYFRITKKFAEKCEYREAFEHPTNSHPLKCPRCMSTRTVYLYSVCYLYTSRHAQICEWLLKKSRRDAGMRSVRRRRQIIGIFMYFPHLCVVAGVSLLARRLPRTVPYLFAVIRRHESESVLQEKFVCASTIANETPGSNWTDIHSMVSTGKIYNPTDWI